MKLHLGRSIASGRAHWMLEEAGVACEIVTGPTSPEAKLARPRPSLPTLIDGDLEIGEWTAIVMHLADKHAEKGLAPPQGSRERALCATSLAYVATTVDPVFDSIRVRTRWGPEPKREAVIEGETRRQLGAIARALELSVAGRAHVVGDTFTAADVAVGSAVAWLDFFGVLSEHPGLAAYHARIAERPAYQRAFAPRMREASAVPRVPPLSTVRRGRSGPPLFFAARPNMGARELAVLGEHLDAERGFHVLQLAYPEEPDLGRPYTDEEFAAWARTYLAAMRSVQPKGPYLLVGVCEGAQIAYQVARLVEAQGEEMTLLAFLDTWPPENTTSSFLWKVYRAELSLRSLLRLPPAERAKQVRAKLARALDRALDRTLGRALDRALTRLGRPRAPAGAGAKQGPPGARQDWQTRTHPERPVAISPIRTKITLFRATKQPYWRIRDPKLGWGSRTKGGVEICSIDSEHQKIMEAPALAEIGRQLTTYLRRLERRPDDQARRLDPSAGASQ